MSQEKLKKTLLISRVAYERFQARHPGHGDFVWFVREALDKYNEINDVDPSELVKLAVGEIDLR